MTYEALKIEDLKTLVSVEGINGKPEKLAYYNDRFAIVNEYIDMKKVLGNVYVPVGGWLKPTTFYKITEIDPINAFFWIRHQEKSCKIMPYIARALYTAVGLGVKRTAAILDDIQRQEQENIDVNDDYLDQYRSYKEC